MAAVNLLLSMPSAPFTVVTPASFIIANFAPKIPSLRLKNKQNNIKQTVF